MSRSNTFKLKPSFAKTTVLACGESYTDKAFLRYLEITYKRRDHGVYVKVDHAGGGGPTNVIKKALRFFQGFTYGFALLDTDLDWPEDIVEKAREVNLILIGSTPCLEGLFLSLLNPKVSLKTRSSPECKKLFKKHMSDRDKRDWRKYEKVLPKKLIDVRVGKNIVLDKILGMMLNPKTEITR